MSVQKIKLAIVEDQFVTREGIASIFISNKKIDICGKYEDGESFLSSIGTNRPDVVLMDISLKNDKSGIDIAKKALSVYPDLKVIMLTVHNSNYYIYESIKIGAAAYLTKNSDGTEIVSTVESIRMMKDFYVGKEMMSNLVKEHIIRIRNNEEFFSDVEIKIIFLTCEGRNTKEIAVELGLSPKTISNYKTVILKKIDARNDIELVKKALQNKLISLE